MIRSVLLLLCFMCFFTSVDAQRSKKKKDDGVEIIEFEDDVKPKKKKKKRRKKSKRKQTPLTGIVLKTNPVSAIRGWQFVEVEYPVNNLFSAQAGLGVTFEPLINNYASVFLQSTYFGFESEQWGSNDVEDDYYNLDIRNVRPGFYGSLSGRFYFYDDAPLGSFLYAKGRLSTRGYNVQQISEGAQSISRLEDQFDKESIRNIDFVIGYGYQDFFGPISVSYFGGFGYLMNQETRQDIGSDNLGKFYNGTQTFSQNKAKIELGIRVGYQF